MPPKFYTPQALADRLGRTYDEVLTWTRLGEIPAIKAGGRYYYDLRKVCEALSSRTETPQTEASSCE